jgi:hypothetical protein
MKEARKWIDRGYAKNLGGAAPYSRRKLKAIRKRRATQPLTHTDIWYLHCSAELIGDLSHWFRLSQAQIRAIQEAPNTGKPWTKAQLAHLSPTFRTCIVKTRKAS